MYLRSIVTAGLIAVVVLFLSVRGIAPSLPRVVGRADVRETRSFSWDDATAVRLTNADGSVRVLAQDRQGIAAEVDVRIYSLEAGDPSAAREYASTLCGEEASEGVVDFVAEPLERPDSVEVVTDCTLLVPFGTDVEIHIANGNASVSSECGKVEVRGRNTDITIKKPRGMAVAETTNGRIRLVDAPQGGRLHTVNGNVYAHMLGGTLEAATTNGLIVAHVLAPEVTAFDLTSQNGGITVVMGEDGSADVEARTARGGIRSDFPVDTPEGAARRRSLRGRIGAGATRLRLDTLNGNIWLARSGG